jgi:hypothetical protein
MKEFLTRENVASLGKVAFAVAVGSYAFLYVSKPAIAAAAKAK